MYWITERLDGTCWCSYRIQDGTEYFTEKTLDLAIERMIQAAWYMNHGKIDASDISFTREREMLRPATVEVVREPFTPPTPMASQSIDEVGPTKYPKGLKGLLMRIADEL